MERKWAHQTRTQTTTNAGQATTHPRRHPLYVSAEQITAAVKPPFEQNPANENPSALGTSQQVSQQITLWILEW
jgi:hypothetical protein